MPELPEVQTTVDGLNKKVRRRRIVVAWHDWHKFNAVKKTKGHEIKEIKRRGKNVLFYFMDNHILLVHMKMTGHLLVGEWVVKNKKIIPVKPKELGEKVNGYIHFILTLDNGKMIGFSDLRKFGKVIFGKSEKIENLPELKKLGPDALLITLRELAERAKNVKKSIYQFLLDQTKVAGIGNIYANDILWRAKISPLKSASKLTKRDLTSLHKAIKFVLNRALSARGTSIEDYRDVGGKKGNYSSERLVYRRDGRRCPRCKTTIKRVKKGGRSVFYCPRCQV